MSFIKKIFKRKEKIEEKNNQDSPFSKAAKACIEITKNSFNETLDYDVKSIKKLDSIIEDGWGRNKPVMMDNVVSMFGSFLGESIIKLHGGKWESVKGIGWAVNISGLKIFPFNKVKKRIRDGKEDSITFFYDATLATLEKNK